MGGTPHFTGVGKSTTLVYREGDVPDVATWARWRNRPQASYHRLQEERESLWFDGACWLVSDNATIGRIVTDEEHFSAHPPAPTSPPSPLMHLVMQQALFYDGEEHRRVSRLMRAALASVLRPGGLLLAFISTTVDQLLCDVLPCGHMDVVSDFATPLTDRVMAAALGLPTSDPDTLGALMAGADAFADVTSGYRRGDTDAIFTLKEVLRTALPHKRAHRGEDLLSILVAAEGATHDEQTWRSEDELIVTVMMLLAAGRVTARKVIADGVHLLLEADTCWRRLSAEVQAKPSAINTLVEHLLCLVTPTSSIARWATSEIEMGGQRILAGQKLILLLEAANLLAVCPHRPGLISPSGPLETRIFASVWRWHGWNCVLHSPGFCTLSRTCASLSLGRRFQCTQTGTLGACSRFRSVGARENVYDNSTLRDRNIHANQEHRKHLRPPGVFSCC